MRSNALDITDDDTSDLNNYVRCPNCTINIFEKNLKRHMSSDRCLKNSLNCSSGFNTADQTNHQNHHETTKKSDKSETTKKSEKSETTKKSATTKKSELTNKSLLSQILHQNEIYKNQIISYEHEKKYSQKIYAEIFEYIQMKGLSSDHVGQSNTSRNYEELLNNLNNTYPLKIMTDKMTQTINTQHHNNENTHMVIF